MHGKRLLLAPKKRDDLANSQMSNHGKKINKNRFFKNSGNNLNFILEIQCHFSLITNNVFFDNVRVLSDYLSLRFHLRVINGVITLICKWAKINKWITGVNFHPIYMGPILTPFITAFPGPPCHPACFFWQAPAITFKKKGGM